MQNHNSTEQLEHSATDREYAHFMRSLDDRNRGLFAKAKRFIERYQGDPEFRLKVDKGIADHSRDNDQDVDVSTYKCLEPVFNPSLLTPFTDDGFISEKWPLAYLWMKYVSTANVFRKQLVAAGGSSGINENFDSWRQRNIQRTKFELGLSSLGIVHTPIAFELSDGCSVGCWFCGVSAKKFRGHFSLKGGGEAEWRSLLHTAKSVVGTGMSSGFLYWATDPLDNPEYIDFLRIYREITGVVPQTTTAIPLRNVSLTKEVLSLASINRDFPTRFSVLSNSQLKQIHNTFTDEELLGVELVLQNSGASQEFKSAAGKAFSDAVSAPSHSKKRQQNLQAATIACVTGFLVNIVTKTVQLISPCQPSVKWKDGFVIHAEMGYKNHTDLGQVMLDIVAKHMPITINPAVPIRLDQGLSCVEENGKFYLVSRNARADFTQARRLIQLLSEGGHTPVEIVQKLRSTEENAFKVIGLIDSLWHRGFIGYAL